MSSRIRILIGKRWISNFFEIIKLLFLVGWRYSDWLEACRIRDLHSIQRERHWQVQSNFRNVQNFVENRDSEYLWCLRFDPFQSNFFLEIDSDTSADKDAVSDSMKISFFWEQFLNFRVKRGDDRRQTVGVDWIWLWVHGHRGSWDSSRSWTVVSHLYL